MFFSDKYRFFSIDAEINSIYNSISEICSTVSRGMLIMVCSMFT